MSIRDELAIEVISVLERRGLRFKLDGEAIVVVTPDGSAFAPAELRDLVERMGGEPGTPTSPVIVGVLLPYIASTLNRRGVETVARDWRGAPGWHPEHGWGSVAGQNGKWIDFALVQRKRPIQLRLSTTGLVLIVPEEQLRSAHDGDEKQTELVTDDPKSGVRRVGVFEYLRRMAGGQ